MAVNGAAGDTPSGRLPCGREPVDVWDHVAAGQLDDHEADCPYCQGVVGEYEALAPSTRELLDGPVEPPGALLERVMSVVRSGRRSGGAVSVASALGPVRLDLGVVRTVLVGAADAYPGARVRSCRVEVAADGTGPPDRTGPADGTGPADRRVPTDRDAGDAALPGGLAGPLVDVVISLAARMGTDVRIAADEVRGAVRRAARDEVGLAVGQIHVDVVDLFESDTAPVGAALAAGADG